jgi:hypothetical protein
MLDLDKKGPEYQKELKEQYDDSYRERERFRDHVKSNCPKGMNGQEEQNCLARQKIRVANPENQYEHPINSTKEM